MIIISDNCNDNSKLKGKYIVCMKKVVAVKLQYLAIRQPGTKTTFISKNDQMTLMQLS